ncbi:hypothetical protein [Nostoc sp. NZL]|uniref:hypothetical protein n=1 Tax=Nostoc sp. NZL TaxID=2650612 RepID=UPI0018C7E346|nr:hypothetical protein [Nostoc sp. NZL]
MLTLYCDHLRRAGTPSHVYYVFSSTLLASCGVPLRGSKLRAASPRVAMTERCGLAAEFYSVGST